MIHRLHIWLASHVPSSPPEYDCHGGGLPSLHLLLLGVLTLTVTHRPSIQLIVQSTVAQMAQLRCAGLWRRTEDPCSGKIGGVTLLAPAAVCMSHSCDRNHGSAAVADRPAAVTIPLAHMRKPSVRRLAMSIARCYQFCPGSQESYMFLRARKTPFLNLQRHPGQTESRNSPL